MANPRAQRPLTLDQAVSDIKSLAQPAQALGDMMASTLRGSVAATAGLPGDIRELINLFGPEAVERVLGKRVMPTTEEMGAMMPKATAQPNPYESIGEFLPTPGSGALAKAAGYGLGRAAGTATRNAGQAISDAMIHQTGPLASGPLSALAPRMAMTNVVKPKGGNWLSGSVEKAVEPLKTIGRTAGYEEALKNPKITPAVRHQLEEAFALAKQGEAVNQWVERNLTNYVKKEMATPEDPVRKLAEEGITHLPAGTPMPRNMSSVWATREEAGFPAAMGTSREAQVWEALSDKPVGSGTAGEMINVGKGEPWMEKVDPFTKVHGIAPMESGNMARDLGFDHILDVLRQDVASGRIRPEQLNKVSMEQAVRRTHEYDQEMARKMAEAQAKVTEGMPVHKEYPEGYKWIELAPPTYTPETLPPGFKLEQWDYKGKPVWSVMDEAGTTYNDAAKFPDEAMSKFAKSKEGSKALEDALKYEGDTMGHCVGGYCPDVLEGRSRIFSLRDAKGEPHVTIETEPPSQPYPVSGEAFAMLPHKTKAQYSQHVREWRQRNPHVEELTDEHTSQALKEAGVQPMPERIVQIKGKQNRAPKEEYLPYVQDFVKSGQWSEVGDLHNANLWSINKDFLGGLADFTPQAEDIKHLKKPQRMEALAKAMDAGDLQPGYATRSDWEEAIRKHGRPTLSEMDDELLRQLQPPEEGMATGGKVSISDNPDIMMMELNEAHMGRGGVPHYDDGGSIKATPRSEGWGTAADIAKAIEEASKQQFGYKNPATEAIADFLSVPAIARTLERKAYGEPVTNIGKANVPMLPDDTAESLMAVAPFGKPAAKGAKVFGKAGLSEIEKNATLNIEKSTGNKYATRQEGPFYRVTPSSLDQGTISARGVREAIEPHAQGFVGAGSSSTGQRVPKQFSSEEVAGLINAPTNKARKVAHEYTKEKHGSDFLTPELPTSSLAKQSAIGRTHLAAVEGSPAYKKAIFDAYAQQMPNVLEGANAKHYDDLLEKAYRQLALETGEQFERLPVSMSFYKSGEGNYRGAKEMAGDVHGNDHLYVFQGGDPHDFLNQVDPRTGLNENEKFRAVHDLFGHAIHGNEFGPAGEEAAWGIHKQMYSPLAQLAMTAETRGQNSVVNYTPLNAKLKSEVAKLRELQMEAKRRGDTEGYNMATKGIEDAFQGFQYAPQKAILLPPEYLSAEYKGGMPDYVRKLITPEKGTETQSVLTHYSHNPELRFTDPTLYGTGIKGAEAERLSDPSAVRDRSYFYMGEPGAVSPEPGLGIHRYRAESPSLYDITEYPLAFRTLAREANRTPFTSKYNQGMTHPLQEANDMERLVREYGYQGMANPKASKPMAIMFDQIPVSRYKRGGEVTGDDLILEERPL